jgi:predicted dinucleotide-binding enzyme
MTTIGIIGAGKIGGQLARLSVQHGYDVVIANSRGPETLAGLVAELGEKARAGTPQEAAEAADIAVVAIPLGRYEELPVAPLAGKVVIDTMNYYPSRDGRIAALDDRTDTTTGLVQKHLQGAKVVKGVNHIGAPDLTTQNAPGGTPGRRALVVAGEDADAKATVAALFDEFGFDVVDAGGLDESWRIENGQPGYVQPLDADELRGALARASR